MRLDLSQKAIEVLIDSLEKSNREAELALHQEETETFALFVWLKDKHPELIREWVEFIYQSEPEVAKKAVSAFHDEALDLSTIPCTGADFEPWKYE